MNDREKLESIRNVLREFIYADRNGPNGVMTEEGFALIRIDMVLDGLIEVDEAGLYPYDRTVSEKMEWPKVSSRS